MSLSLFNKGGRSNPPINSILLLQAVVMMCFCAGIAVAQRSPHPARDMAMAIGRKEMDRLLLLKPLPPMKDDPARRVVLKQIAEDFKELQNLNNKMMAQAWAAEELDYRFISDMVSQIRGKANRLKTNLAFPEIKTEENKPSEVRFSDHQKFRAGLLLLDRRIMSFATNPLFQKRDVVEVDLANKASLDLEAVIDLTTKLKKEAANLNKVAKTSP